jgi:hypothetical protein
LDSEAWEEAFFRFFARFSASSLALISSCGTATNRRMKFVNWPKSPVGFFAGLLGLFGIRSLV